MSDFTLLFAKGKPSGAGRPLPAHYAHDSGLVLSSMKTTSIGAPTTAALAYHRDPDSKKVAAIATFGIGAADTSGPLKILGGLTYVAESGLYLDSSTVSYSASVISEPALQAVAKHTFTGGAPMDYMSPDGTYLIVAVNGTIAPDSGLGSHFVRLNLPVPFVLSSYAGSFVKSAKVGAFTLPVGHSWCFSFDGRRMLGSDGSAFEIDHDTMLVGYSSSAVTLPVTIRGAMSTIYWVSPRVGYIGTQGRVTLGADNSYSGGVTVDAAAYATTASWATIAKGSSFFSNKGRLFGSVYSPIQYPISTSETENPKVSAPSVYTTTFTIPYGEVITGGTSTFPSVEFSEDGSKMFIFNQGVSSVWTVYEFTLAIPNQVTSATLTRKRTFPLLSGFQGCLQICDSGRLLLYQTGSDILSFGLLVPYDVSSKIPSSDKVFTTTHGGSLGGFRLSSDGRTLLYFYPTASTKTVPVRINLTTPYDIASTSTQEILPELASHGGSSVALYISGGDSSGRNIYAGLPYRSVDFYGTLNLSMSSAGLKGTAKFERHGFGDSVAPKGSTFTITPDGKTGLNFSADKNTLILYDLTTIGL